ncbi:hypothetical protein [Thalassolituus sp.]|uniref:hypothetical protein n=1 Tax=Thalassolituus sp. TaxID=2030822 RepID=UPI0035199162
MSKPNLLWIALISATLAACGGGGDPVVASSDTEDDTTDSTDTDTDDVVATTVGATYFPLQFLMTGAEYTDFDGYFASVNFNPLIKGYLIAPVDGTNLQPLETPKISDYVLTVNGETVDPVEQGLIMQKVIGLPTQLKTALVVDTSGSVTAAGIDKTAYINSVKNFISTAQASSDPVIAGQEFTLWAFADAGAGVDPLVDSFTTNAGDLNTALDGLLATDAWDDRGTSSAAYEAIVKAVGSYTGTGAAGSSVTLDMKTDAVDDLVDGYRMNVGSTQLVGVDITNVVLFSSGPNTNHETFWLEDAEKALMWQSLITYDTEAETEEASSEDDSATVTSSATTLVTKPLIFVSLGTNDPDENIAGMAAQVIDTDSVSTFNVASQVIAAQQNAVSIRTRPDNQYLVRFAMPERNGTHEVVFSSNSGGYEYVLTTEWDLSDGSSSGVAQPSPTVEITGPSNAYLPEADISLANVTTLYPATRWTVETYEPSDYSWTVGGAARTANADGSVNLSSGDAGQTVVLTNDVLGTTASRDIVN